jgi:hypothetical protein
MGKKGSIDTARRNEVRRLFQKLYPNATTNEVATFYSWLEQNNRDLLPPGPDPYLPLKSELEGLWNDARTVSRKRKS